VLHDFMLHHSGEAAKERLLVGIKEEDGQPLLLDPFAQPHSLIAGSTGSGKSVLMQNIILCIAATRSPDESRIFLIDPKYGVDYMALQDLPHITGGSGGVIDSQEAALECLEEAVEEMERRLKLMKAASTKFGVGVPNILAYREITGEQLATWWMIHDEFADWMQTDDYKAAIPALVNRLGVKARAAGIFLIFGAQRPDNSVFPMQLRSQLLNRLVLRVDGAGTSEIALGEKGGFAERLLGKGHMLAKLAGDPAPVFAQVPFIDPATSLPMLVSAIIAHHKNSGHE
jgi:S-DNA-T family DNA segregation ATPase FtsK/SpoIIIE